MKMYRCSLLQLLSCFAFIAAVPIVLAQPDQSGFISIDCGLSESSNYTDPNTGIFYTSDAGFPDSSSNVALSSPPADFEKPILTLRSFLEGIRNCYTLRPVCQSVLQEEVAAPQSKSTKFC